MAGKGKPLPQDGADLARIRKAGSQSHPTVMQKPLDLNLSEGQRTDHPQIRRPSRESRRAFVVPACQGHGYAIHAR